MRILVVEDDAALRSGLKTVLERAGYRAFATGDGIDADDLLKDDGYDLVVLDLGLQGKDGLKVLRRMRERGQSTPVLILSARDQTADRVRGLKTGADDYIGKPYDAGGVLSRARQLIGRAERLGEALPEVLLIDDSLTFREEFKVLLEAAGHRVATVVRDGRAPHFLANAHEARVTGVL